MMISLLLTTLLSGGGCTPVQVTQGLTSTVVCGGDTHTFSVTATGSNLSYSWCRGNGMPVPGSGPTLQIDNIDLEDRGLWCVIVSNECSSETSCARLSVQRCQSELCTLTQGAYGNPIGQFNGMNRVQLITGLLSSGPITLGIAGTRSLSISSAQCVIDRLPAAGQPSPLPAFGDQALSSQTCQSAVPLPLTNNGNFKNVLLGQTISLALNTRLSPNLGSTPICTQMMTSNGPVYIPLTVITSMSVLGLGHSVDSLLQLANRALAGQSTGIASFGDINVAVQAINRGFDECATLEGCY